MGILNNLTADNRTNKSLFVKLNGVQTLMQKLMMDADGNDDFIEVAVSSIFGNEIQSFSLGGGNLVVHTSTYYCSS